MLVACALFDLQPDSSPHQLTQGRLLILSARHLASLIDQWDLLPFIFSRSPAQLEGGWQEVAKALAKQPPPIDPITQRRPRPKPHQVAGAALSRSELEALFSVMRATGGGGTFLLDQMPYQPTPLAVDFADVVKSIAGAIFIDSRLNLQKVWQVMMPILLSDE
eukprot:TRINITY_DN11352_c0_g1_i3.p1 TRINITY_DN11352_c0_g1~~TRINITY_DN11352_c0_g1_i3.p1  ORF type:complete len:163 (+),score=27.41 TRINITY_DN11352_c0_g1_i3:133-621(+)